MQRFGSASTSRHSRAFGNTIEPSVFIHHVCSIVYYDLLCGWFLNAQIPCLSCTVGMLTFFWRDKHQASGCQPCFNWELRLLTRTWWLLLVLDRRRRFGFHSFERGTPLGYSSIFFVSMFCWLVVVQCPSDTKHLSIVGVEWGITQIGKVKCHSLVLTLNFFIFS